MHREEALALMKELEELEVNSAVDDVIAWWSARYPNVPKEVLKLWWARMTNGKIWIMAACPSIGIVDDSWKLAAGWCCISMRGVFNELASRCLIWM